MRTKILAWMVFTTLTGYLSACASDQPPMMFGMPQNQFQQLTVEQQNQVIAAYNQQQQTQAQSEMVTDVIDSVAGAIHH